MSEHVFPDRDTWLAARRLGIGGSDASAVLGLSPFSSPLQLWAEKRGLLDPVEESEAMRWGRILEPLVADRYTEETKRQLAPSLPFTIRVHDERPWLRATLDREITMAEGKLVPAALELKTTNGFRGDDWDEEPPIHVQIQGQHQLLVTGWAWVSFAVLIGGQTFKWCDLERNDKFLKLYEERAREFWRRVELGDPPPAGATDREVLAALYPKDTGATVLLPAESAEWDAVRVEADEQIAGWKKRKDEAEAKLRAAIGEASHGQVPRGGPRYSCKLVERGGYTVEPTSYRQLRRYKGKST